MCICPRAAYVSAMPNTHSDLRSSAASRRMRCASASCRASSVSEPAADGAGGEASGSVVVADTGGVAGAPPGAGDSEAGDARGDCALSPANERWKPERAVEVLRRQKRGGAGAPTATAPAPSASAACAVELRRGEWPGETRPRAALRRAAPRRCSSSSAHSAS